jgi:hypothetical protein
VTASAQQALNDLAFLLPHGVGGAAALLGGTVLLNLPNSACTGPTQPAPLPQEGSPGPGLPVIPLPGQPAVLLDGTSGGELVPLGEGKAVVGPRGPAGPTQLVLADPPSPALDGGGFAPASPPDQTVIQGEEHPGTRLEGIPVYALPEHADPTPPEGGWTTWMRILSPILLLGLLRLLPAYRGHRRRGVEPMGPAGSRPHG